MDLTVYVLLFGISVVSPRHTLNVNKFVQSQIDPNHSYDDRFSDLGVERRNIDYISNFNSNQESYSDAPVRRTQPVYNTQYTVESTYITESDHAALISEKIEASNNIGNEEFKLRTNAYPTQSVIVELTTESFKSQRRKTQTHEQEQNIQNRFSGSETSAIIHSRGQNNTHRSEVNTNDHFIENQRSLSMQPNSRFIPDETQPSENHNKSSHTHHGNHGDVHIQTNQENTQSALVENKNRGPENLNVRPFAGTSTTQSGPRGIQENGRVPKEKDEEETPWIWGTEPGTKVNTTDVEDLDDRAAFDGSPCATGYVKVNGICVEKH